MLCVTRTHLVYVDFLMWVRSKAHNPSASRVKAKTTNLVFAAYPTREKTDWLTVRIT